MPASPLSETTTPGLVRACEVLSAGGTVVYPTETLYGLGVDACNPSALESLVVLKVRAVGKPISVLVAGPEMLESLVSHVDPAAQRLMEAFWPGPLTIVLPARPEVSSLLTAGHDRIGVRISSHPVARALVESFGRPVTTPSANPAGAVPPRSVDEARAYFGGRVGCYLDGGTLPGEPASTVVEAAPELRILREGAIPRAAIEACLS